MKISLTTKQEQVLLFIKSFIKEFHYSPTYSQIGMKLDIHRSTVRTHLMALQAKGWLVFNPGESRTILIKE